MTHDLIVFAEDWGALPSSTQHIIKELAKSRKVVWINSIGLRQPTFCLRDIKRLWHKLTASKQTCLSNEFATKTDNKPSEQFHIVNPKTIPAPQSKLARALAKQLLKWQIQPVLAKTQLQSPILWTSLPTAVDLAGSFDEHALVYYCGDDFSGLAGVDHHTVTAREKELVDKADLIIASSQSLVDGFNKHSAQLLTHGVDQTLFTTPCQRALDLPDAKHIAGFYGSISNWLDMRLLSETIQQLPEWQFVFIGKIETDISEINHFKNVTFLGPRPHHLLPSYSQHWTASLLPFVDNKQIQACNPLKLKEYLAAGRPVISTSFNAITPYRALIQVADNSAAMVEALRLSTQLTDLAEFTPALRQQTTNKSWQARAQQVEQWLGKL